MTDTEKKLVEKICKNVNSPLKKQIETIAAVTLSLQKQLEDNYADYLTQPLSISVVVGTGETVKRANPYVQEYRALFRDYISSVKQLAELIDDANAEEEINALVSIKDKFKIAK